MRNQFLAKIFIFLVLISNPFTASAGEQHELTLEDVIMAALEENFDIKIQRFQPRIHKADIGVQEGAFDPELDFLLSKDYQERQSSTQLEGSDVQEIRKKSTSVSLGQKLKTGTTYELKWIFEKNHTNSIFVPESPYYASDLVLEIRQQLLKGRGNKVQTAQIQIAKNNFKSAKLDLTNKIGIVITDVEKLYWDLLNAYEEHEVAILSLELAEKLYEVSKAKIKAGILPSSEILQSEAEIAVREEDVLKAEKHIRDVEDLLKAAINYQNWDVKLIPTDKPQIPDSFPETNKVIAEALEQRNDYQQAVFARENAKIRENYAKNNALPDLSLVASAGLNGLNKNSDDTFDDQFSGDFFSWNAGVVLSYPLGNNAAQSELVKARVQHRQAIEKLLQIRQTIILEVREAIRSLSLARKNIEATIKSEELSKKRLDNEEEKFENGMSTAHDVLTFQEAYAKSLSNKKKAVIDYVKALADLRLVKIVGTQFR